MKAESMVTKWAKSTEGKITQFLDDYLINFPQGNVRKSTQRLLTSLFKKGTEQQREDMLELINQRINVLHSMGKSSEEFLELITCINESFPELYQQQKKTIFLNILSKLKNIFSKITTHPEYQFYSLCANMIDFNGQFKPYLLEANGCLKCFGRPENEFESLSINNVKDEVKVHINCAQFNLKRKYEIKNLKFGFGKKKVNYKSVTLCYKDDSGERRQVGKYTPNDNIPLLSFTTSTIIVYFEFAKSKRNHITCVICSSAQEYSYVCTNCLNKMIQIEGSFKVVGGDPEKISKELCESYKQFNGLRQQLQSFAICVEQQTKVTLMRNKIIPEMSAIYLYIIQNLKLLKDISQKEINQNKKKSQEYTTDCYSCHFFEFQEIVYYISDVLKDEQQMELSPQEMLQIITDFRRYFNKNKIQSIKKILSDILSRLILKLGDTNYYQQLTINEQNHSEISDLLARLLLSLKEETITNNLNKASSKENLQETVPLKNPIEIKIKNYILCKDINRYFDVDEQIRLFTILTLTEDQIWLIEENQLDPAKMSDLKRLTREQYEEMNGLITFTAQQMLLKPINNYIKIFLRVIPEELMPSSFLQLKDAQYLKYTKNIIPEITQQYIKENIVYAPNPILKLNLFKILPELIKTLPLEQGMKLVTRLCQFKDVWNLNIKETISNFDKLLSEIQLERKLMLSIKGFSKSKEHMYFEHIYKILTPQRPNFIVRFEIPELEMQKQEKLRGGPVQYIYLPIREVKSEDLKGDTIGALHQWVRQQFIKLNQDMPFDLIVEKNIIDNLDLSLEIVYKKIVQKEIKKQIGNQTYDFFKVIYRVQGIFGEANERISGNPRDQKLEDCINYSSYLLTKISQNKNKCGLDILMQMLPTLSKSNEDKRRREMVIKILEIIFKNQTIIKKIVEWQYGDYILNLAVKFLSLNKTDIQTSEMLLEMCSKVIDQANNQMTFIRKKSIYFASGRKESQCMDQEPQNYNNITESQKSVKFILEKVKIAQENGMRHISKKLIKILPFCSKDDFNTSKFLFDFFDVMKFLQNKFSQKVNWLMEFVQALSESYKQFKNICKESGVTQQLIKNILSHISVIENVQQQKNYSQIETIELSLTILKGLLQGDLALQENLFERGILQQIYRIGTTTTSNLNEQAKIKLGKIPLICFEIIKYFQEGKIISAKVQDYFESNQKIKKESIKEQNFKKKEMLKEKKRKAIENFQSQFNMNDDDAELVTCSSCKEGYKKKKEVLGLYLYSSKIQILALDSWWKDHKKINSITSTSYFTAIHYQCHVDACKDDQKIQKQEWEGALIRNSDVLCNNWCGFKGPKTTDEEFEKVHKKYFERNGKNGGFWVVLNDLNALLERFSKEYDFSLETKGSSYSHNIKLILVLISYASHLMKNSQQVKYLREGCAYIEEFMTKKPNLVNLYFCISIFLNKTETFEKKKVFYWKMIQNLNYSAFKDQKSHLIYLSLVNEIVKLTNRGIQDEKNVALFLNTFIPENFVQLISAFEKIEDKYKNQFLKWGGSEEFKKNLAL